MPQSDAPQPKWSAEDQALIDYVVKNFYVISKYEGMNALWDDIKKALLEGPNGRRAVEKIFTQCLEILKEVIENEIAKRFA